MSTARRSVRIPVGAVLSSTALAAALLVPGSATASAVSGMTVADVTVAPGDALAGGFTTVTVSVMLTSTTALPDVLTAGVMGEDAVVVAEPAGGDVAWAQPGETPPTAVGWPTLTRVAGTAQEGTWRGTVRLSTVFTGDWLVTGVHDYGTPEPADRVDVSGLDGTFTLGATAPAWRALPAPTGPVRVVTGTETWVPRAQVTDRRTGAGVSAFWLDYSFYAEPVLGPVTQLPAGAPLRRADPGGYLQLPAEPVVLRDGELSRHVVHVYGGRGSRGFSWEAATALWPYVKWQANERFTVAGDSVVANGNAWPAPAIYPAVNPTVHLQHLVGRTWRTVASGHVRDNGRYTVTWTPPAAGTWVVRVYKPGGADDLGVRRSAGTTLPAVVVRTP